MYVTCVLYVYNMFITCVLHVYYMCIICILCIEKNIFPKQIVLEDTDFTINTD